MTDKKEQNIKPAYTLSDLGEVAFIKLQGVSHHKIIIDGREVLFVYDEDLSKHLELYWRDEAKVSPREYKLLLDSLKRLVFSYLRSKGLK